MRFWADHCVPNCAIGHAGMEEAGMEDAEMHAGTEDAEMHAGMEEARGLRS